jgi:hypothetical protein
LSPRKATIAQMRARGLNALRRLLSPDPAAPPASRAWIDESVPGWMTRSELEVIAAAARGVAQHGVIVEIGSFAGRSSVHWAANSHSSVDIYCIDPFEMVVDDYSFAHIQGDAANVRGRPCGELFAEHTREWADRLIPMAQASPPSDWQRDADLIFVDGDHTREGVARDLQFWIGWLKPDGRLLGHDWDDARVRESVEAFASQHRMAAHVHLGTQIWELIPATPYRSTVSRAANLLRGRTRSNASAGARENRCTSARWIDPVRRP